MKKCQYIFAIILLVVVLQAMGQPYVIDKVCVGSSRNYRVEGEAGSTYTWFLKNEFGVNVPLSNPSGKPINPPGVSPYGNEISIDWKLSGKYFLEVIQNSVLGCDTLEQGFVEVYEQPVAIAGVPLRICSNAKVSLLNSFADHYSSLLWTSSGDGTFDDPLAMRTAYNPGPNDLAKGDVQLTLTAQGLGSSTTCPPVSSLPLLATFMIAPNLMIHNPETLCLPETADLSASAITTGSDPNLTFEYFADSMATTILANYKTIAKAGTYYIRGTSSVTGCRVIKPVKVTFRRLIIPLFPTVPELCLNSAPPALPSAYNSITGHWSPETISTSTLGWSSYHFVPDPGQCAKDTTIMVKVSNSIVPTFSPIPACQGDNAPSLPAVSLNGIPGTWNPAIVSTDVSGKFPYTFTPDPGSCGETITVVVTIKPGLTPTFSFPTTLCLNSAPPVLPTRSVEGKTGTWIPAVISTNSPGASTYFFTPDKNQCAAPVDVTVSIVEETIPLFDAVGPLCLDSYMALPNTSKNGITGTWTPSPVVDTSTKGVFNYTFTPDDKWCASPVKMDVKVYDKIVVQATAVPLTVYGGTTTVTVTATGGSGVYTGTGTFPNISSGWHTYTVIDDAGCTGNTTIFINEPQDIALAESHTEILCKDGLSKVTLSASGGTPDYRYFRDGVLMTSNSIWLPASPTPYSFEVFDSEGRHGGPKSITITEPPVMTLTGSATPPACLGGSDGKATVVATGAYGPLHYEWRGPDNKLLSQTTATVTGLSAGTYTVTVIDDCPYQPALSIAVPDAAPIALTATGIASRCPGSDGSIQFAITGIPDGTYTITHATGQFNSVTFVGGQSVPDVPAPVGTYTNLQLMYKTCLTDAVNATVAPAPALTVNYIRVQPTCNTPSGFVVVTAPKQGTGFVYSIDNGPYSGFVTIPVGEGSHMLNVKELASGCETHWGPFDINPAPVIPTTPVAVVIQNPSCNNPNGTVKITSPLSADFEYTLNGITQTSAVFSNLKTGTYTITVRDTKTGCVSTIPGSVYVQPIPSPPVLTIMNVVNPLCAGDPGHVSFTVSKDGLYTIRYDNGGEINNVLVRNGKGTVDLPAGNYLSVTVESDECTSLGVPVTIVAPPAIEIIIDQITEIDLKSQRKGAIDLHAIGGSPFSVGDPYKFSWNTGEATEDIKDLSAGTYIVTVTDSRGCPGTKTIIIPAPNYPPVAVDDQFTATCNVITGNVKTNDSDPENDPTFVDTKPVVPPLHGTLTLNIDGTFTYSTDSRAGVTDQFVYALYDKNKVPGITATVTIIISSDMDGDGIADDLDPDADGDGILNVNEVLAGQDWKTTDTDGDGHPNYLDIDSDGDGIVDNIEAQPSQGYIPLSLVDANHNGIDDAYDPAAGGTQLIPVDTDADGIPDFLDSDSDNDMVPDYIEGHDQNSDGRPDHIAVGKDSDRDGLDDAYDTFVNVCALSENATGSNAAMQDFDGDGKRDWRDENDDDDEYLTRFEDLNMDGDYSNDDIDFDGHPEYLDYGRDCDLFVPEAFSPNNDNIHDYFQVYCINHYPNAHMYIFDQNGNKLFEKEHYGNLEFWGSPDKAWWDGRTTNRSVTTNNGKVLPGTYYYVLKLGNGDVRKSFVFVSY